MSRAERGRLCGSCLPGELFSNFLRARQISLFSTPEREGSSGTGIERKQLENVEENGRMALGHIRLMAFPWTGCCRVIWGLVRAHPSPP